MQVADVMTSDVITVRPEMSIKDVARLLLERSVSGVVVVDEADHALGVVSETDILYKERPSVEDERHGLIARLFDREPDDTTAKLTARTAGDAMTSPAVTIDRHASVARAADLMLKETINRLVVTDAYGSDTLVGIVTRADLVRAFARSDNEIAAEVEEIIRQQLIVPSGLVQVDVRDGDVTIAGEVDLKSDAEQLARSVGLVPGVVSITSNLRWHRETPIEVAAGRTY
jgi:CBS domain-containing protein